jgi:hypothetical protein
MSSVHRPAGFLFSALFALGLAACGDNNAAPWADDGDDDDGDGATLPDASGGDPDSGGGQADAGGGDKDAGDQPDAGDLDGGSDRDAGDVPDAGGLDGGGAPDAGEPDAGTPDGGAPDAGPDPLDGEFLLALQADLAPDVRIRLITTVDFTDGGGGAGVADFTFQPIVATNCSVEMGGLPVGATTTVNAIPIDVEGAFQIVLSQLTLPALANAFTCTEVVVDEIDVLGTVQSPDLTCGTVSVTLDTIELAGTFGAIRIPPGTVGDENLPAPVVACP